MIRVPFASLAAVLVPGTAVAGLVEDNGYRYVQIPLSGLWSGFFVFLFGIAFCLVGLFVIMAWRRSARRTEEENMEQAKAREEEERVF